MANKEKATLDHIVSTLVKQSRARTHTHTSICTVVAKTHRGHMVWLHSLTPVAAAATIGLHGLDTKRHANTRTRACTRTHQMVVS